MPTSHGRRPGRRRGQARIIGAACVAALVGACDTQLAPPTAPRPSATVRAGAAVDAEHQALDSLTRAVALALSNDQLRQRVKRDMRASRITAEHKLEVRPYLRGDGAPLLALAAQDARLRPDSIIGFVQAIRPLEFYMPLAAHREQWTGGADLIVAAMLDDSDTPIAYDLRGERVDIDKKIRPATPTLTIVPRETDFSHPLDATIHNSHDGGGQSIGTYMICEVCEPTDTPVYAEYPTGRYFTFLHLDDLGEPWLKGAPEIEVHVHGPPDKDHPTIGADLACSGEHSAWPRNFNMDGHDYYGDVMLFSSAQETDYAARFSDGYNVMVWEDDDTACVLKLDNVSLQSTLKAARDAFGAIALVPTANPWSIGAKFIGWLYNNASWLLSNDEFLGAAVPIAATGYQAVWNDANVMIMRGTSVNGRMWIRDRTY